MKRIFTCLVPLVIISSVCAQSPEKMSYQAVIRGSNDQLMKNTSIGMQISILQGSVSGTAVYVERQFPTTNVNGLATIEIGGGTIVSGTITSIDWANGLYFIKIEIDLNGGANYTITGTTQLLSVPYALYSKAAKTMNYNGLTTTPTTITGYGITDFDFSGAQTNDILQFNGTKWVKFTPNFLTNETQNLSDVLTQGSDAGNKSIVNVSQQGIGTSTPNTSSALDITSTTKGFLPPRMTETEIAALAPVEGLQVYNTTKKLPIYYDGSNWRRMDGSLHWIGENYAGGIVFYIDSSGEHGLVCAPTDQSTYATWGCYGTAISGADDNTVGSGNQNTLDIVNGCSTAGIAARICYDLDLNGYTDWYLPTLNELGLMCYNLKIKGLGDFTDINYWSSLEVDDNHAWNLYFLDGSQYGGHRKDTYVYVRAIRAF